MNILLFGGNSQRNKDWIHEVGDIFSPDFGTTVVHDYDHWDSNGEFIDFEAELAKLSSAASVPSPFVVFAKSIGSVLTLMAMERGILAPEKCFFVGLPIKVAEEDSLPLPALLKSNVVPTFIVQNSQDPVASYARLLEYLDESGANQYETLELQGDTHSYDDLAKIKSLLNSYITQ